MREPGSAESGARVADAGSASLTVTAASRAAHLGLAAVIGFVVGLVTVDRRFWSGDAATWSGVGGDAGAGLAAFRYFVAEPWSLNLFAVRGLGDGTSLLANDSIPLLALIAKLVDPIGGPAAATWWGAWMLLAFPLHAVAGTVAVRSWGARTHAATVIAATLAVTSPILLHRSPHPGLLGGFWVLFALAWAGSARRRIDSRGVQIAAVGLPIGAWLTHPYLGVMTGGIVLASIIAMARLADRRTTAVRLGGATALGIALVAAPDSIGTDLVPDQRGWIDVNTTFATWPIVPQRSTVWPGEVTTASYEGMAWIGLGGLTLVVGAAIVALRRHTVRELTSRWQNDPVVPGLLVVTTIFTAYAISPRIRLWPRFVLDLSRTSTTMLLALALVVVGAGLVAAFGRCRGRPGCTIATLGRSIALWSLLIATASLAVVVAARSIHGPSDGRLGQSLALMLAAIGLLIGAWSVTPRRPTPLRVVAGLLWVLGAAWAIAPGALAEITSQLRASGRFVWPAAMMLAIAAIVTLDRRLPVRHLSAVAVAVVALQVIDTTTLRGDFVTPIDPSPSRIESVADTRVAVADLDRIELVPGLACLVDGASFGAFRDIVIAASYEGVATTPGLRARAVREECPDQLDRTAPDTDGIVVLAPLTAHESVRLPDGWRCEALGAATLCSASSPG